MAQFRGFRQWLRTGGPDSVRSGRVRRRCRSKNPGHGGRGVSLQGRRDRRRSVAENVLSAAPRVAAGTIRLVRIAVAVPFAVAAPLMLPPIAIASPVVLAPVAVRLPALVAPIAVAFTPHIEAATACAADEPPVGIDETGRALADIAYRGLVPAALPRPADRDQPVASDLNVTTGLQIRAGRYLRGGRHGGERQQHRSRCDRAED